MFISHSRLDAGSRESELLVDDDEFGLEGAKPQSTQQQTPTTRKRYSDPDSDSKFQMLETSSVDDDLANLKNELSGGSKKGELPPGRSTVPASTGYPFKDSEIENELKELRRKAKEF
ncbi:BnaA02g12030D [Brassica napus]|uniref:BnaA02g12030D protein n=1 Tax=Brassica napus TaxID=3708 RepID=A0A078FTX5_BRANA|nr:BnaA02g12030D [Brassica napus]